MVESNKNEMLIENYDIDVYWKFLEYIHKGEIKRDSNFRPGWIVSLLELSCEYCMLDLW